MLGSSSTTDGVAKIRSVLLVEDDRMISMLIKSTLEKEGFNVFQCYRGDVAQQEVGKVQPDLVLLDLGLPGLDGFQVCHLIREIYSGPLLILTAHEQEEEQVTALNLGADDYLIKPVSPAILKARIHALFRRQPVQNSLEAPSVFSRGRC